MSKKLIALISTASLLFGTVAANAEELTCEKDNKVAIPAGKLCCCKTLEPGDKGYDAEKKTILCSPTAPVEGKCPSTHVQFPPTTPHCTCKITITTQ